MAGVYHLREVNALDAAEGFARVAADCLPDQTVELRVSTNLPMLSITITGTGKDLANRPELAGFQTQVKDRPYIRCISASLMVRQSNAYSFQMTYAPG